MPYVSGSNTTVHHLPSNETSQTPFVCKKRCTSERDFPNTFCMQETLRPRMRLPKRPLYARNAARYPQTPKHHTRRHFVKIHATPAQTKSLSQSHPSPSSPETTPP